MWREIIGREKVSGKLTGFEWIQIDSKTETHLVKIVKVRHLFRGVILVCIVKIHWVVSSTFVIDYIFFKSCYSVLYGPAIITIYYFIIA